MSDEIQFKAKEFEYFREFLTTQNKSNRVEKFDNAQSKKLAVVAQQLFETKDVTLSEKKLIVSNLEAVVQNASHINNIFEHSLHTNRNESKIPNQFLEEVTGSLKKQLLVDSIVSQAQSLQFQPSYPSPNVWVQEMNSLLEAKKTAIEQIERQQKKQEVQKIDQKNDLEFSDLEALREKLTDVLGEKEDQLLDLAPNGVFDADPTAPIDSLRNTDPEFEKKIQERTDRIKNK